MRYLVTASLILVLLFGFLPTGAVSATNSVQQTPVSTVIAQDFGVYPNPDINLKGYSVGFSLVNAKASDVRSIIVLLKHGDDVLASAVSAGILTEYPDATQLSAPFDVLGDFDYEADGMWTYSGWNGPTNVIPDRAEIIVTFNNYVVKTANTTNLTGDTAIFTWDVFAQDFAVMNFSGVKGYNVGFGLVDATAADLNGVAVTLYDGETVLATAATDGLLTQYPTATSLSAPFDVFGGFNYPADGAWTYTGWNAAKSVIPTKAEITVTYKDGSQKTVTNTYLDGDTSIFTKGGVNARGFGVENRLSSKVKGYNVGLTLVDATLSDAKSIQVKLYKEDMLLATVVASQKLFDTLPPITNVLSAPIDVLGTFDYAADGYWIYSGWTGPKFNIPTKAEITVTYKNDVVATAINDVLTGDTSIFTKGDVTAQDFGPFSNPAVNLNGYNVGFNLINAKASDVAKIEIKLYNGETVQATATSTGIMALYPDATTLSAPFDVLGTFDYNGDGAWDYSGWSGPKYVIPTKAEITVTFKNDVVATAINDVLTGDTSVFTNGNVVAQDFGVWDQSGVLGYSVGFGLVDAKASDVSKIVVKLYNGETVLATATSLDILTQYPTATDLSAPFDVLGSFDYEEDAAWTYSGWQGLKYVIPTKAEITVTFKNDVVKSAVKENPAGDTSIFTKGDVVAQDFGVWDQSGVLGYSVGFGLVDAKASDVASIVVKLYKGETVLATATNADILTLYPTANTLSAPFDVLGTFDYVADAAWTYSGWQGLTSDIPTKAEITVTFKNDVVKTAVKETPAGDTTIFTSSDVVAQDFTVYGYAPLNLNGYNVGFGLIGAKARDVENVVVKLYKDTTILATATSADLLTQYPDTNTLSAPFDVLGTFDYVADAAWTYSGWEGPKNVIPTKAEITVTFKDGTVKTIENTNLNGDTSPFTKGGVTARAFGVENRPTTNGMVGYNVGLTLVDGTLKDTRSVKIELYNGNKLLATVDASQKVFDTLPPLATALTAPLDVMGTFNYAADGYWLYSGWNGPKNVIPTKAVITVTFKNDVVATAVKENPTGDTSVFTRGDMAAQDFTVYTNPDVGIEGYNVGFNLINANASDVANIVVKLYKGTTVLATATSADLLTQYPTATTLSAPFDVLGDFNYEEDGAWTYSGWDGLRNVLPDQAEITVTFKNDVVKTATNTTLNGDTTIFTKKPVISNVHIASDNDDPTKATTGDTITLTFTADEPVSRLGTFLINGKAPVSFTNVGKVYTATYVVSDLDLETGKPVTFTISVENRADNGVTVEATTDDSSVTIYHVVEPVTIKIWLPIIHN